MAIDQTKNTLTPTVDSSGRLVHRWMSTTTEASQKQRDRVPDLPVQIAAVRRPSQQQIHASVEWYSTSQSYILNARLRTGQPLRDHQVHVDVLDATLATERPMHAMQVYRGLSLDIEEIQQLKANSIIEHAGYCSTSEVDSVSRGFAGDGGLVLSIDVPAGTRCIDVTSTLQEMNDDGEDDGYDDGWDDGSETEILFPRGTRLQLTSEPVRREVGLSYYYHATARMLPPR